VKPSVKRLLDRGLSSSPAQPVFRRRAADRLAVIAYHGIDDAERFGTQLDYLRRAARPVTLEDVIGAAAGRRKLPERALLITFDDGDRSLFDVAMPMLVERELPAAAFVVAGLLGTETPYWWDEVEELSSPETVRAMKRMPDERRLETMERLRRSAPRAASPAPHLRREELPKLESAGIAIGNHSVTHPCLSRCSDEKVRIEIEQAHGTIASALGHPPASFAYPDGDFDPRVREAVASAAYEVAFLFDHRLERLPVPDPLRISRLRTNAASDMDRFRIILSGLHPAIHHALGRA